LVEKSQAVSSDRAGIDKGSACVVAEAGVPDERNGGLVSERAGITEVRKSSADRAVVGKDSVRTVKESAHVHSDRPIIDDVAAGTVHQPGSAGYCARDDQSIAGGDLQAENASYSVKGDGAGAIQDARVRGGRGDAAGPVSVDIPKAIPAILPHG